MALTRKMLQAMEIPAEKIDEIIAAHSETVTALKEERDSFKADAEKLPGVESDLKTANAELEKFRSGDWEKKYNDLKSEYTTFKTDTEAKATKAAKEAAYKKLLLDSGISDKRIASILKVSDVDNVTLDKDGNITDAETLSEKIKTEWADFIVTEGKKGAEPAKPPANEGSGIEQPSLAKQLVAQYRAEHYGNSEKED